MSHKTGPIRVAVTGGPGAGKTSLLEGLTRRGYAVIPEVARQIIADRTARGLTPRPTPIEFAKAIVERDVEQYDSTRTISGLIFFDRSLIDSLGLLAELNQLADADTRRFLERCPYHSTAFILPPWREIYRTDSARDQSYEQAVRVYRSVREWYRWCGYTLIEVPRGTIDERCECVLRSLGVRRPGRE
jgi:predicted ATPase